LRADIAKNEVDVSANDAALDDPIMEVAKGARAMDVNAIINSAILVGISVAVLSRFAGIDSDLMRGWTPTEVAYRVSMDNWYSYSAVLQASPVSTKAFTSGTVYTIGDIIAQRTEGRGIGELDRMRILRSMIAGFVGHGPMSHLWYEESEYFFDNVLRLTAWWSFIPKVILDQTFWGPIWNNTYILMLGIMKGNKLPAIWEEVKRTTIPLIVSGLKLWPLAHCVTYGLIPVENRLLWVDMVEILWVTILATQANATPHGFDPSTKGGDQNKDAA